MSYTVSAEIVGLGRRAHRIPGAETLNDALARFKRAYPDKTIRRVEAECVRCDEASKPEQHRRRAEEQAILDLMADGRERTVADVSVRTGISCRKAGQFLIQFRAKGLVKNAKLQGGMLVWRVS